MTLKSLSEKRKKLIIIVLIAAAAAALSTAAYARYINGANKSETKLSPAASIKPVINEDFNEGDTVKKNVSITVGDTEYPVYVRAALIFNWKKKEEDGGELYFSTPLDKPEEYADYKIELDLNEDGWVYNESDGYYYYKKPVESKGTTGILIKECTQLRSMIDGEEEYTLNVEIIAQTVQAVGHTDDNSYMAVEDAWGWSPSN